MAQLLSVPTAASLEPLLIGCGYQSDNLRHDLRLPSGDRVALAGFAYSPHDARSACLVVLDSSAINVEQCRLVGAPICFSASEGAWNLWSLGAGLPQLWMSVPADDVGAFLYAHRELLNPEAIYRAKTWARFDEAYQLDFVDVGLMPLVEEEVGSRLSTLIEQAVVNAKDQLGWREITDEDGHWLLKATFWLLAGKILKDKAVPTFSNLDLGNVTQVFATLAKHYGAFEPVAVSTKERQRALESTARMITQFSNLSLVSTESLAYLYENALITRETRAELGTHSTPGYLVDYIFGKLRPWIEGMHYQERSVFEPACGHAAFLLGAMRVLTELLPEQAPPQGRHEYLRTRLRGIEIDGFALEIARLRLTLADVPNPNGWDLRQGDVFRSDVLTTASKSADIVVANPPFEDFSSKEQSAYAGLKYNNKAAEIFFRAATSMQPGAIFGFVLPQNFVVNRRFSELRRDILSRFELGEIVLLPDKVFTFSDSESVILLGRKQPEVKSYAIPYRRLRESQVQTFRENFAMPRASMVPAERFQEEAGYSFLLPELDGLWRICSTLPRFEQIAQVGQGFSFRSIEGGLSSNSITESAQPLPGLVPAYVRLRENLQTHEAPDECWVNLDSSVIARPRYGATWGVPQVVLNYAPVSREPWRIKAFLDPEGHAVTSRFLVVRPRTSDWSIEALWGLCNSPLANAFCYAFATKRDHTAGMLRRMPVPDADVGGLRRLKDTVSRYLAAARRAISSRSGADRLRLLRWEVDAQVLALYKLPSEVEWELLDLFSGVLRRGVPFDQDRYIPDGARGKLSLLDLIEVSEKWKKNNERRSELIVKRISARATNEEMAELEELQRLADARVRLLAPLPYPAL